MTRTEALLWFLENEDSTQIAPGAERDAARVLLGHEPTAEDWDRLPEIVRGKREEIES